MQNEKKPSEGNNPGRLYEKVFNAFAAIAIVMARMPPVYWLPFLQSLTLLMMLLLFWVLIITLLKD